MPILSRGEVKVIDYLGPLLSGRIFHWLHLERAISLTRLEAGGERWLVVGCPVNEVLHPEYW
jgi:hypothetical protein